VWVRGSEATNANHLHFSDNMFHCHIWRSHRQYGDHVGYSCTNYAAVSYHPKLETFREQFQAPCLFLPKLCNSYRFSVLQYFLRSRDSSVGIATRHGLDGPGIESRWGARYSARLQNGSEAHPAFYTMGTRSFPGVKRPGRGVDHSSHLASGLKKEWSYTSTPPLGVRGLF
jgi:hypothetical protein